MGPEETTQLEDDRALEERREDEGAEARRRFSTRC